VTIVDFNNGDQLLEKSDREANEECASGVSEMECDGSGPGPNSLQGYQEIKCHMIFDIKMDGNFTRKARLVAGGHTTKTPASSTYSSVVSRESVQVAFLLAALNDLDLFAANVGNAYLNAPCREKIWCRAGKEFGSNEGCIMIIV